MSHYESAVMMKNPVGYWRLGEAAGPTALDITANGYNGAYKGTPVFQEQGAIASDNDTAIKLDGGRSYVEIPSQMNFSQPTSGNGLTVEAWFRPDALEFAGETGDPYVHWLGKGEHATQEWAFRIYTRSSRRPNRISAYVFSPAGGQGAGAYFEDELTVGKWIHVVACFDPGDASTPGDPGVHIYRDGVRPLGPPSSGTVYRGWHTWPAHGGAPVRFGTQDLNSFLTGGLDEIAIYPRVLTESEIFENYQAAQATESKRVR